MAEDFLFPGSVWFLGPKPPYHSLDELARVVLCGRFEDAATRRLIPIVYVFSDRDLAERFVENAGPGAAHYVPLALPDGPLVAFLEELMRHGHRHVGIDAEARSAGLCPIPALADQIRRRGGSPPGAGPPG